MPQYETEVLVDLTSMRKIWWYLQNDETIKAVIDVKALNLPYIGDICEKGSDSDLEALADHYRKGEVVILRVDSNPTIPMDNCVHCIRLEPYYIVKDLQKPYK